MLGGPGGLGVRGLERRRRFEGRRWEVDVLRMDEVVAT